jgi:hypothetical protein
MSSTVFHSSITSGVSNKEQRDRAFVNSYNDVIRLNCGVSRCIDPPFEECTHRKRAFCTDHTEPDQESKQHGNVIECVSTNDDDADQNNASELSSSSPMKKVVKPHSDAPIHVPKLKIKQIKEFIQKCLSNF